jgi:RHS repeat-associated protein
LEFGELYPANGANGGYDNLNQLTNCSRGTLSASIPNGTLDTITTPSRSQSWNLDVMGNFTSQTTGTTSVPRTHNMQNEVTSVGQPPPANLAYDANGNMTTDETGRTLVYDAWNRLVKVNDTSTTLANYAYDALNRRITERGPDLGYNLFGLTHDLYYSANWQVVEERYANLPHAQYVWSPVYVDALVLRDRDTTGTGTLAERLYVQQDANFNVTALVNRSGAVVERYAYDPYGASTAYDPTNWTPLAGSAFAWLYLHQGGRYELQTGLYDFRNREYSPTLGRFVQRDPIGFLAGDTNVYRYVSNSPNNATDSSGLVSGWRHHPYPLYFGGSANQVVADLQTVARHQAAHNYLAARGFPLTPAGQSAWARLSPARQRALIVGSLRAAGVRMSWISANISNIMAGANPGVATPRPSGFPGGVARVPIISIALGAILNILVDPGVARAGEIDRTWRGLPSDRCGNVEITERVVTWDMPYAWNLLGNPTMVSSWDNPDRMDVGVMTVGDARTLEGTEEVCEGGGAFDTRPVPFGYYRIVYVGTVVHFQERDTCRGGTGGGGDADDH